MLQSIFCVRCIQPELPRIQLSAIQFRIAVMTLRTAGMGNTIFNKVNENKNIAQKSVLIASKRMAMVPVFLAFLTFLKIFFNFCFGVFAFLAVRPLVWLFSSLGARGVNC